MKKLNKETIKKLIPFLLILIIVAVGSFYFGKKSVGSLGGRMQNGSQFSGLPQGGSFDRARSGAFPQGGGFVNGSVLTKDNGTLTIDVMPNGSRIVLFSSSTKVMKSVSGTIEDIAVGTPVLISGTANKDGSIMANSIQVRNEIKGMRRGER